MQCAKIVRNWRVFPGNATAALSGTQRTLGHVDRRKKKIDMGFCGQKHSALLRCTLQRDLKPNALAHMQAVDMRTFVLPRQPPAPRHPLYTVAIE
jgi:hypothetical protein